jgi:tryptophan synthase beta chain
MTKKILLSENDIPTAWYNIAADMPNKPLPPLNPATKQPLNPQDLEPIFAKELIKQELSVQRWIQIPDQVRQLYKIWRPTPLVRACGLEKALGASAHIYFKNESLSPVGSHKLNSALPQAFYNKEQGVRRLTTETGAGQWGAAMAFACNVFGLGLEVYMVKVSYNQKPYRRIMMQTWGAQVYASPSDRTEAGRNILASAPNNSGSLGIAISEAVEKSVLDDHTRYTLGSVLNHVILHQTIIGLESEKQMEIAGEFPDVVIGCFGGGSNFSGISFPFLRHLLTGKTKNLRIIAAEPSSCPKLSRGKFEYDYGDSVGLTPLLPMYTLGHEFQPADIHAGGLRYHGAGTLVSQLRKDGFVEVNDIPQLESFEAGCLFAQTEGIIPAPESTHAIASAIREAKKADEEGIKKVILFNLSGHGLIDMSAYDQYLCGEMKNYDITNQDIEHSTSILEKIAG